MEEILTIIEKFSMQHGIRIISAALTLFIGLWLIKRLAVLVHKIMEKRKMEQSLKTFLSSLLNMLLKVLLVITVLSTLGIEMTSFIAILGAAGFAVGMALSGTLSNFAGGVIILLLKPFKVGHVIDAQGYIGTVKEIQIFHTVLNTFDNRVVIIPNGALSTGSLTNISLEPIRRVDWTFGIAYGDNYDTAKELITKLLNEDERVLNEPAPFIALHSLGDSSVNIVTRAWVEPENFWAVHFDMNEKVYKQFPQNGLNIPFPQMDVHVHNKK